MANKTLKTNVRPMALKFLLVSIAIFVLVDALSKFNIIDLTGYLSPIMIPLVASFFVLLDVGVMQLIKKKKVELDAIDWFSIIIASVSLLGVFLSLFRVSFALLSVAQGFTDLFLLIFVVINIFKE